MKKPTDYTSNLLALAALLSKLKAINPAPSTVIGRYIDLQEQVNMFRGLIRKRQAEQTIEITIEKNTDNLLGGED